MVLLQELIAMLNWGTVVLEREEALKKVYVSIHYDAEADVYWANSENLRGLVVEAKTKSEVREEAKAAAADLLDIKFNGDVPFTPELVFSEV